MLTGAFLCSFLLLLHTILLLSAKAFPNKITTLDLSKLIFIADSHNIQCLSWDLSPHRAKLILVFVTLYISLPLLSIYRKCLQAAVEN